MGHEDDESYLHYQSNVVGLDVQSHFLGKEPQKELISKMMGMSVHRNLLAPKSRGSSYRCPKQPYLREQDNESKKLSRSEYESRRMDRRKYERQRFQAERTKFFEESSQAIPLKRGRSTATET